MSRSGKTVTTRQNIGINKAYETNTLGFFPGLAAVEALRNAIRDVLLTEKSFADVDEIVEHLIFRGMAVARLLIKAIGSCRQALKQSILGEVALEVQYPCDWLL